MKKKLCNCRGCKLSRDPMSGYQPCHKLKYKNPTPPKGV